MATTAINFDIAPSVFTPQTARVWTKATWANAWSLRPDLIPLEAQWHLAPTSSTATLYRKYGRVMLPGASTFTNYAAETSRGYWVLIEYPDDAGSGANWYWLGYAESPINSNHEAARDGLPASGEQRIPCFGFLDVLRQAFLTTAVHVDPADDTKLVRALRGATFNKGERGNRHTAKATITEGESTSTQAYGFATPDNKDAEFWSTRDIVEHLVAFHLPTPSGLQGSIPFVVNGLAYLPDWDRPVLRTDGRDVASLLEELLTFDKRLTWGMSATAAAGSPPSISAVNIEVRTTLPSPLSLPAFDPVPANPNLYTIQATTDPNTVVDVTADESDVVDQVIVQGPPEIGVGTFRHQEHPDFGIFDAFVDDWTASQKTEYEEGASTKHPDWDILRQYEKREHNERVRMRPDLARVFRRFAIDKAWRGELYLQDGATTTHLFYKVDPDDPEEEAYVPFLSNCKFLRNLPLYAGVDYTVDFETVDETTGEDVMPAIVMLKHPDTERREDMSRSFTFRIGLDARLGDAVHFEINAGMNNDAGPKLDLFVSGAPQHAIAGTEFTGTDADVDQARTFGGWDYKTLEATLALQGDRRPYWALPANSAVSSLDVVRRKIITIEHPALELVHVAEDTVVGFDDSGEVQTCPGGVLRDPTDIIKSLTTVYAEHYLVPRHRMELRTLRRPTQFAIGGIVTTVTNYGTINALLRSITISTPLEGNGDPEVRIIAARAEFDPMALLDSDVLFESQPADTEKRSEFKKKLDEERGQLEELVREVDRKQGAPVVDGRAWVGGIV